MRFESAGNRTREHREDLDKAGGPDRVTETRVRSTKRKVLNGEQERKLT